MNNNLFIYFDVGNTLVDCSTAFQTAAKKFNLTIDDIGIVFDENHEEVTKGVMSAQELWKLCIKKYNIVATNDYDFLNSWVSDYKPIPETHKLINKIKTKYKIGLLSNIYKDMLPLLFKKKLIPNIQYDQIIFSCDVGMRKPDLEIYKLAQEKAQTKPDNILLIDDRPDFLEPAKHIKWQTFHFNGKNTKESVREIEDILS